MTSVLRSFKQISADAGYFITLSNCSQAVFTPLSVMQVTSGLTTTLVRWSVPGSFSGGAGDLFKDMGRSVMGQGLTFRKVQYVDATPDTNGVSGSSGSSDGSDYNVGYILLADNGAKGTTITNAVVAPVAKYGL